MAKLKVGVLISGRGSNLQALIDACADAAFPAEIAVVISNIHGAFGLERAQKAGIETAVVAHADFPKGAVGRPPFESALNDVLGAHDVDFVCLAGFMRLLSDGFVTHWHDRLVNIHPSLLPSFKGLHVHEQAIDAGVRFSGCTVHFVRPAMDDGPIIAQAAVPVLQDDTADDLAGRILEQEHVIYPLALRLIAEGRISVKDERVMIDRYQGPATSLPNPNAG